MTCVASVAIKQQQIPRHKPKTRPGQGVPCFEGLAPKPHPHAEQTILNFAMLQPDAGRWPGWPTGMYCWLSLRESGSCPLGRG